VVALIGPVIGFANAVEWRRGTFFAVLAIVLGTRQLWRMRTAPPPLTYHGADETLDVGDVGWGEGGTSADEAANGWDGDEA